MSARTHLKLQTHLKYCKAILILVYFYFKYYLIFGPKYTIVFSQTLMTLETATGLRRISL